MTSRPSRSASIPISRNSTSTSPIESVISIPFINTGVRSRLPSLGSRTISDDHRGVGVAHGVRGGTNSTSALSTSPVRATARSFTQPVGSHLRPSSSSQSIPAFEPRIIRAESSRNIDPSCLPFSSNPPVRTRRISATGARSSSMQRNRSTSMTHSAPISFPRPEYLDHSSFKDLLRTEAPAPLYLGTNTETNVRSGAKSPTPDSEEDSNASHPPRKPAVITVASPDQTMELPTRWSYECRHESLSLSENGRELSFQGASCNGDKDAAAARSVQPIPPACGVYYYEVEIHSKGQKAHISVGFAGPDVKLARLPGWEPMSWGYHGDDGCSFATERNGTPYGPTFGLGDIVGCGVDFSTNRAFFTKNGTCLGPVFENVGKDVEIYPTVGLQHTGEAVKVNFGHEPFRFDIEFHVLQQRQRTWASIMSRPLDPTLFRASGTNERTEENNAPLVDEVSEEQSKQTINKLVLSYLAHHGYLKTLRAFQKQARDAVEESPSSPSVDDDVEMDDVPGPSTTSPSTSAFEADIETRTRIVNCVIAGDIDATLTETKKHYPGALEAEEGLLFVKLRCRKFVELVLESAELEKKMKAVIAKEEASAPEMDGFEEDRMGMDVDDDVTFSGSVITNGSNGTVGSSSEIPSRPPSARALSISQYDAALNSALAYGQTLNHDFKITHNPEIKQIFTRTFTILAASDPLSAGGAIAEVAGHDARVQLANELNEAILRSQGRPTRPSLEMMYRQTAVCLFQLGLFRVGAAAFANMQKEFLDV
ncbi:SPRY-domain-containing protein [Lentinula boryana]|uniref:SPRY-domain-containing protein n=1 Tax=Lentinula boryana TaxID=40481 RepID=A0ABQ8QHB5_9AGAR|nr:SPRY-domain-containing protein [Lentinula boryana]